LSDAGGVISTIAAIAAIAAVLAEAGIEEARREARLILAFALGVEPGALVTREVVPDGVGLALARRRAAREPLAYIFGRREFWSLEIEVSPATLIPRPDSETLIEAAVAVRADRALVGRILDLGTGTGALLLAALSEFPAAFGVGVDVVAAAAMLARRNAARLGLGGRCGVFVGDWAGSVGGRFDLVLANPPYVARGEIGGLMPEVAGYEPLSALDGGVDGFDAYRVIIADLPRLLAPGGVAVIEAGAGQAPGMIALAAAAGMAARGHADLAGVVRAVTMEVAQDRADRGVEKNIW
jgi:release factor glutamine methyltransferase